MHRILLAAGAAGLSLTAVACGSGAAATNSGAAAASADPSASPGARGNRGGNAGEVVQVNGTTLVLNTAQGDLKVSFTASTPVSRTSTGVLADITQGLCITATGTKDAGGAFTATAVAINDPVNGSCAGFPGGNGRPAFSPNPNATPDPSRTPRPNQGQVVRGQVSAADGVSITVMQLNGAASGQSTTITVPTTVTVSRTASASISDLAVGVCVAAIGQKDSTGTVAARTLNIFPAGASGCTGGGGRGFGGFPGGGFGGGGGGGAGAGAGAASTAAG
jgi:hypothetical protein